MTNPVMEVQLIETQVGTISVVTLRSRKGEPHDTIQPPFTERHQLEAISLALDALAYEPGKWAKVPAQYGALKSLGLVDEHGFVNLQRGVGRLLLDAFFPEGALREALHATLAPSYQPKEVARLELKFDAPYLGSLPWELLCDDDGTFLFSGRNAVVVRYVVCNQDVPPLLTVPTLRVLLIAARPHSETDDPMPLPPLSDYENGAIEKALATAQKENRIEFVKLPTASALSSTYSLLVQHLDSAREHNGENQYHVLHIDAHGGYGKRCEKCRSLCEPVERYCRKCMKNGSNVVLPRDSQGYVAFEAKSGAPDWTSAEELASLLRGRGIRLVVLTACKSAVMSGKSIFSGIAPAIIRTGVPGVVAMQFSISDKAAWEFTYQLYRSICWHRPLTEAIAGVHPSLFHDHPTEWYKPVLYLRTNDENPEGYLFSAIDEKASDSLDKETATVISGLLSRGGKTSQAQEVQNRVAYSCSQIRLMAYYKRAHDLLQRLDNEFRAMRRTVDECSEPPLEEAAPWSKLKNLENMKRIVYELTQHMAAGQVSGREQDWVVDVSGAPDEIDQATEANSPERSMELLEHALISVEQAIKIRSPQMNKSMVDAMRTLNLSSLVGALRGLWLEVQQDSEGEGAQGSSDFSNAIESLDNTSDKLQEMLYKHDDWQQIEDELRPWLDNIQYQKKIGRFKIHWETRLKHRVMGLGPSTNLRKGIAALEEALSDSQSHDVVGDFRSFYDKILTEFSKVDTDLNKMCEDLYECSARLKDMVKTL